MGDPPDSPETLTSTQFAAILALSTEENRFIATDYVTSPNTPRGQLVFGAGCGVLTYVIRTWAGYPEGVAFAVLLMNSLTPIIDSYIRPRIYGRNRQGVALEPGK